jgi:ribosomal protein S18 acetylase RimI-like enzyme
MHQRQAATATWPVLALALLNLAALSGSPPAAAAAPPTHAERMHTRASDLFRQGRFPEAYGRFIVAYSARTAVPSRSTMKISAAVPEDAQAIAWVHIRSWQAAYGDILEPSWLAALSVEERAGRWRQILSAAESQAAISRQDGAVTGFVSFGRCRDEGAAASQGEILALYVAPAYWGRGTGRALLAHAASQLEAEGFHAISLWVLSANLRGRKFYESCGFAHISGSEKLFELAGRQVEECAYRRLIA